MKKLLFLLLFVCSTAFGQMTITPGVQSGIYYELFTPKVPSDNWVIWEHGIGEEKTVNDGSQLSKLEISGVWLTAARNGFEFPFNIIAPQIDKGSDWWKITNGPKGNEAWFLNWIKETLKAKQIIATGYSLGGRGMWNLLQYDTKNYLNAIAPVCGYFDPSSGNITSLRSVPVYGVHGDKDTTMPYSADIVTENTYNPGRPTQLISGKPQPCYYLVTIPGAGHTVWPNAYDVTPGKDGLLQWVIQQFGPAQTIQDPVITTVFDGTNIIETTQSGKVITIKPTTVN